MKYKIWDKQSNLITPIGTVLTPQQIFEKYPAAAIKGFDYIICDAPISMGVFMQYDQTVDIYEEQGVEVAEKMTKQEKLDKIREFETRVPVHVPTAEERMAAAMEFQNLLAMESVI
jgi:hypothetical protein